MGIRLRDLSLNTAAINAADLPDDNVQAIGIREAAAQRVADDKPEEPLLYITMLAVNGGTINIKLPLSDKNTDKAEALKAQLRKRGVVVIKLIKPVIRAYAMKRNDGSILEGVSVKADTFEIPDEDADLFGN